MSSIIIDGSICYKCNGECDGFLIPDGMIMLWCQHCDFIVLIDGRHYTYLLMRNEKAPDVAYTVDKSGVVHPE